MTLAQAPAELRAVVQTVLDTPDAGPQTRLLPRDATAQNDFGVSVAISGNTALIGASTADGGPGAGTGAAYVFVKVGPLWVQEARLVASDATPEDNFGADVALDGDTALIGAPNKGILGGIGAAYVFVRSGTAWSQQSKLTAHCPTCGANGDFFGNSVALSGDTALVAADGLESNTGAVFAFLRSGTTWAEKQMFTGADSEPGDSFGWSVSLSGSTAVVGAPRPLGAVFAGAAYVFVKSASGFIQQAVLTPTDGVSGDLFGHAVALSGQTAIVGAPGCCANIPGGFLRGTADVFVRSGDTWTQQTELTASDGVGGVNGDAFGSSVTITGNAAVIGAPSKNNFTGAAYEFIRGSTGWAQKSKFSEPDGMPNDRLGFENAVAIAPGTAFVGRPFHNQFRGEVDLFPL
jgi:hypothetical protein